MQRSGPNWRLNSCKSARPLPTKVVVCPRGDSIVPLLKITYLGTVGTAVLYPKGDLSTTSYKGVAGKFSHAFIEATTMPNLSQACSG